MEKVSETQEVLPELFNIVLLIEDEDAHAFLITRALKKMVAKIDRVATVAQAIEKLGTQKYDLIISDLQLPDSSGVKGVERVVASAPVTPLIVLTSSRSITDAVQAMRSGARDYLVKEFDSAFQEILHFALARLYTTLKLEAEQTRLRRETEILRVAIENSTDAMAIVDREANIHYLNRTFIQFIKSTGVEVTNENENLMLEQIFTAKLNKPAELKEAVIKNLKELERGAAWHTEVSFAKEREQAFDLAVSVVAVDEKDRNKDACVLWLRDISELKRREKFQREILSTTSHDLKGPLGAISLSAELITELTKPGEKPYELALRIASSARGAINLIEEFLSARRIQEGTFILKPTSCSMSELFEELKNSYIALTKPKSIEFCIDIQDSASGNVDRLGFQRAIGNLLSNAVKFTEKGGKVFLRARRANDQLVVEVEDSGTGMEPAELKKIFERFGRLERHSAIAGSGLGLFVVKSIVKAHGGSIEVTSQVGKGTKFSISFPDSPPVNERGELISLDFN